MASFNARAEDNFFEIVKDLPSKLRFFFHFTTLDRELLKVKISQGCNTAVQGILTWNTRAVQLL